MVSVSKVLAFAFAFSSSLVVDGLVVSGWSLSLLWVSKPTPALLGNRLLHGRTCAPWAVEQPKLWVQMMAGRIDPFKLEQRRAICLSLHILQGEGEPGNLYLCIWPLTQSGRR